MSSGKYTIFLSCIYLNKSARVVAIPVRGDARRAHSPVIVVLPAHAAAATPAL